MNFDENIGLVYWFVNKKYKYSRNKEDLIQEGFIGLINALYTFDKSYGAKFSTYAIKCVDNQIKTFIRDNEKDKSISFSSLTENELKGICKEIDTFELELEILSRQLNERQTVILKGLTDGLSVKELADELKVSRTCVYKKIKQIKGVLNEEQNNYNTIC